MIQKDNNRAPQQEMTDKLKLFLHSQLYWITTFDFQEFEKHIFSHFFLEERAKH